ncbi:ketose-bisphosphate aldolase [Actinomyces sp. zg-332]|uniref:class II fructose-bisphosphate aldolase n=1 Tax=Actinomyces sp. zg-332 TaxID=2708340 RepID=UPI0018E0B112|nr:ketose-bisphosphate aldolase [Actinomyces sp. zg-332]QPK94238.1 ketose-bisphosphate aldolase [Actinomyces sp. zg-332]
MKSILDDCEKHSYAIGSFNVSSIDQVLAVIDAANLEKSPALIQPIVGTTCYDDEARWWAMIREAIVKYSEVPIGLHLDHGLSYEDCVRACESGFTSVMIDASRNVEDGVANSFEDNVETTLRVVEYAHAHGIDVEGEIGTIGGGGEGASARSVDDIEYTDPLQAKEFVTVTGVDALAIGAGTSHGSVKFPKGHQPHLAIDLIKEIHSLVPDTHLVLHGSSSIGEEDVDTINKYHGVLSPSCGIADEEKVAAIAAGVRKINQGTDSHLAFTAAMREYLALNPSDVDPYFYLKPGINAMVDIVRMRMRVFGSAGRAI